MSDDDKALTIYEDPDPITTVDRIPVVLEGHEDLAPPDHVGRRERFSRRQPRGRPVMEFEAILKHDRQIMVSRMLALDSPARQVRIKTGANRWIEAPVFSEAEGDPQVVMDSILETADRTWPKAEKLSVLHVSLAKQAARDGVRLEHQDVRRIQHRVAVSSNRCTRCNGSSAGGGRGEE
jgi:hypothetical protein